MQNTVNIVKICKRSILVYKCASICNMCKKCVTYLVCGLQMSRILRDLPMCCVNGTEFASFTVFFLEFTGFTPRLLEQLVADSANFA